MIHHFTPYRDIAFDVFIGDKLYPPAGWYFERVISVEGEQPPYNYPQEIGNYGHYEQCQLPRVVGEQSLYVNTLGMDIHFLHEQISVMSMVSKTHQLGFQKAFVAARVRPLARSIVSRFDAFDQDNLNQVVTEFWSVKIGTNSPSMREYYFPALNTADSMVEFDKQNKELKAIGHELLVRYYQLT